MSCDCDETEFPPALDIPPGQDRIHRQIAGFPAFRTAMLTDIGSAERSIPLAAWGAREGTDLGVMLIEMWAYLADILAFYDEVYAHECYLRTARLRTSLTGLVEVLSYVPAPATAATVDLALFAEGRNAVTVPAGTAFRSGAVDGGPPQVFELETDATIHPLRNEWSVTPARATTADALLDRTSNGRPKVVFDPKKSSKWGIGDVMLVAWGTDPVVDRLACTVVNAEEVTDGDGKKYQRVTLSKSLSGVPSGTSPADLRFYRPGQTAGLWLSGGSATDTTPDPSSGASPDSVTEISSTSTSLTLDGVYRGIRAGQLLVLQQGTTYAWFTVSAVAESGVNLFTGVDGESHNIYARIPVTRLTLDAPPETTARGGSSVFSTTYSSSIVVHHRFSEAGGLAVLPAATISTLTTTSATTSGPTTLAPTDTLALSGAQAPADDTGGSRFGITDVNNQTTLFSGEADLAAGTLTADGGSTGAPTLTLPARVWGNIVTASRGETVEDEVLGSGDASVASQAFTLKKSPLTMLVSASAPTGVASTLRVWVDGVLWSEVSSFYAQDAGAQVYRVALDEAGVATVTFGDGERGSRLPTGTQNVVASYRYGAGASVPPSGSIKQIARPATGLRSVAQPLAATGGSDAESADRIRTYAPRQALVIGRAVSIKDFEAVAAGYTGVDAATASWEWDGLRQRPVVRVWYIGDASLADGLLARLQALSDPTTPFRVGPADEQPVELVLAVTVDSTYDSAAVLANVAAALGDPDTGPLPPARIGIGAPFYFSRLRATAQAVAGVQSVRSTWTRVGEASAATSYATSPGSGGWFRFYRAGAADMIDINGEGYSLG